MKKALIVLARLIGAFFIVMAVGVLFFDKELWMMIAFAAIGSFILLASVVWPAEDDENSRQPAVIINPHTMAPDFEGYRPGDGDIPQQQPTGELYVREQSGEMIEGEFDQLVVEKEKNKK